MALASTLAVSVLAAAGLARAGYADRPLYNRADVPPILNVPSSAWDALNKTVGGRLAVGRPIAAPCYATYNGKPNKEINLAQCLSVQSNKTIGTYLAGQIGGYMEGQWAGCSTTGQDCPLDFVLPVDPINPLVGNCQQGQVSNYYIKVASPSDAAAGMAFANTHGIPLVVKNTGHDYKGRSAAPNSLALWTHPYQPPITLTRGFVPAGCSAASGDAITFGAGQGFLGIYEFADQHNITVVGGSSTTVGAAGGWITGGGHSALSPTHGLGVDNVQELKAVLPSGEYVTASRCQNQDIFFALRGGGGGTFGVIMEMTTKAHPQVTLQLAQFVFASLTPASVKKLIGIMVENGNKWADEGFGGYLLPAAVTNGVSVLDMLTPILTNEEATKSMQPIFDFAKSLTHPGTGNVTQYGSFLEVFNQGLGDLERVNNIGEVLSSRLIPTSTLANQQEQLTDVLFDIAQDAGVYNGEILPVFLCATAPNPKYVTDDGTSAVTPAWRSATWHLISVSTFNNEAGPKSIANHFDNISQRMQPLRNLTPGSGAYINEADANEPDHINSFWGQANYAKLMTIKQQVDPKNLLTCHQCVGWDETDPRFSCYPPPSV